MILWVYYGVFISWWKPKDFLSFLQKVCLVGLKAEAIGADQITAGPLNASEIEVFRRERLE